MSQTEVGSNGTGAAIATSHDAAPRRWNMLLYWMSSVGEGSWDRFRTVVSELAGHDGDLSQLRRSLRVRLSDFAHVDFFISDSKWKTLPPLAAGLVATGNTALLIGARTPNVLSDVQVAAARHGVVVTCEAWDDSPDDIRLEGTPTALSACAVASGVDYADGYAWRLAAALGPIPSLLDRPRRDTDDAPINWAPRSFDLHSRAWVDGSLPNSACEFTPRYGRPRYFVSNRRRKLLEVNSRRDAVYAAAFAQGVSLAAYDSAARTISVPLSAPLPEAYARAACLCSGRRADVRQGRIVYEGVPRDVGAVLLTALGQPAAIVANVNSSQRS
jgi:hypothetical protein